MDAEDNIILENLASKGREHSHPDDYRCYGMTRSSGGSSITFHKTSDDVEDSESFQHDVWLRY